MSNNVQVFFALLRRDLKVLFRILPEQLINQLFFVVTSFITFGKLLPATGLNGALIAPVIISSLIWMLPQLAVFKSYDTRFDLAFTRKIDFEVLLPLPSTWLVLRYILDYFLSILFAVIPTVIFARILLGGIIDFSQVDLLAFILITLISILFFSVFLIFIVFTLTFEGFNIHLWPRILIPIMFFSTSFFTWEGVEKMLPKLSKLMLLNPLTYCIEGIRISLLGTKHSLHYGYCVSALLLMSLVFFFLLKKNFKKRLDNV